MRPSRLAAHHLVMELTRRRSSLHARTRLAENLEDAVLRADRPHAPFSASVPVCARAPRPVDPEGMRLVRVLLTDGGGPLYVLAWPGELRAAALRALLTFDRHGLARQRARRWEHALQTRPPTQKRSHVPLLLAAPPTAALGLGIVGLIIVIVIVVIIVTRVL
jgi:hypothetical protein